MIKLKSQFQIRLIIIFDKDRFVNDYQRIKNNKNLQIVSLSYSPPLDSHIQDFIKSSVL
jgi:hypothetical protein